MKKKKVETEFLGILKSMPMQRDKERKLIIEKFILENGKEITLGEEKILLRNTLKGIEVYLLH